VHWDAVKTLHDCLRATILCSILSKEYVTLRIATGMNALHCDSNTHIS
jgi:hypothetical protein